MISVFGGTGFVGSEFCQQFKDEVTIIDRNSFIPISDKVLYFISTVDNYNVLTDSKKDINTNLIHLMNVLDECKNKNIEFTFISSWFVYGETDLPATERSICKPKGFYSITKYAAELLLESYCKTFNIKYKIIRLGNVLGNSDGKISKKKNALQFLISEIKENKDINLYNNGNFYRDFIHVSDVAKGIKYVMERGNFNEIYNLGCGIPIVFKSIIDYAVEKTNSTSKIGIMDATDFHKIVQVESMYLDTNKLNSLGFKPEKNIYQIVDDLLE
jgi:nucleoside-diphosphate-sugar epimerase